MSTITMNAHIKAPVSRVFEVFADIPNAEKNVSAITGLEMLTDGPVGVGTKFRESRVVFKKEATEEMEIVAFEPGKSYTVAADSCGSHIETRMDFVPDQGGTRLDVTMNFAPQTFFAKIMSPLGKLMAGSMKKMMMADFDDLRAICEGGAEVQAEAAV